MRDEVAIGCDFKRPLGLKTLSDVPSLNTNCPSAELSMQISPAVLGLHVVDGISLRNPVESIVSPPK